jgi:hypothetical protein
MPCTSMGAGNSFAASFNVKRTLILSRENIYYFKSFSEKGTTTFMNVND